MHKVFEQVQSAVSVPLVHIADATADALLQDGIRTVALLGTKYTMQQDFYKKRLIARGINVLVPDEQDVETVNHVIFHELCLGVISDDSRAHFVAVIDKLEAQGAQGVILGCTEIGLLIGQEDTSLHAFDTAYIHAQRAADLAYAQD